MDTLVARGIKSSKDVRILNSGDILNHDISNAIMLMVHDYVEKAKDLTTTPEDTWKAIRDSVLEGDLKAILIAHMAGDTPVGFMYCCMDPQDEETAIIHCAYSRGEASRQVVSQSLALFEDWARFNKARHGRFYTFRVPGAHRLMLSRDWKHCITTYKKEL